MSPCEPPLPLLDDIMLLCEISCIARGLCLAQGDGLPVFVSYLEVEYCELRLNGFLRRSPWRHSGTLALRTVRRGNGCVYTPLSPSPRPKEEQPHAANHVPRLSKVAARTRLLPARHSHARWLAADHPGVGRYRRRAHIDQYCRGTPEGAKRAPRSARRGKCGGPGAPMACCHGPRASGRCHHRGC